MKRLIYILLVLLAFVSCVEDPIEKTNKNREQIKHTVLIYAVNKSSLSADFSDDSREMLAACRKIDLDNYQLLVYKTDSNDKCGLYSVMRSDKTGAPAFELVREYERNTTSTDPARIKEVIDYSLTLYPNSSYDLIFWGHGMSWKPYFTDHSIVDSPALYSYGGEYNGGYNENGRPQTDWTEIDELAAAVPDNVFNTIWFDCCYMSGIETIYEFRNKCKIFVGYPSEVWSQGLAYDIVLPYLLSQEHDVTGAAMAFFNYYKKDNLPVTVAVLEMDKLEKVADLTRNILASGSKRPEASQLLNYSRTASSPFYDYRQFISSIAELNEVPGIGDEFIVALDRMTLYHAAVDKDFNLQYWNTDNICGINTHFYSERFTPDDDYYRTLAWYKRVYL